MADEQKPHTKNEMRVPLLAGVGNGPVGNRPRAIPGKSGTESPESEEKEPESGKGASTAVVPKQDAAKSYKERLVAADIDLTEARGLLDSLLQQRFVTEVIQLTSTFTVIFCTRLYRDTLRTARALENETPTFQLGINDLIARYNLAASLYSYGDTTFSPRDIEDEEKDEEAFQERLRFVLALPEIVTRRLVDELSKFDQKMALILSEGAIEDF